MKKPEKILIVVEAGMYLASNNIVIISFGKQKNINARGSAKNRILL
jgi:hypothetical protein